MAICPSRLSASSARRAAGIVGGVEEAPEGDGLAEHRRGLGEGERRGLVVDALLAREVRVQPVTHLVGEGEHVAAARGPVEQQVRVLARHGVRAERAGTLARTDRRVDPRLVEEPLRRRRQLRRERRVRVEHQPSGLVPTELLVGARDRRHAVVVGEAGQPEQLRLRARTTAAGCRSATAPRRRAPAPTRRSPRWRGSGSRTSWGSCRSRSSIDLSTSNVLNTNARVRSPGARPTVTASAAERRTSRSGDMSCESPCSRLTEAPSRSTVIAEVSSENRRTHALLAVSDLSARIRSSGSLSRCGR